MIDNNNSHCRGKAAAPILRSTGCQPVIFGSLPTNAGKLPALPRIFSAPSTKSAKRNSSCRSWLIAQTAQNKTTATQ